MSTATPPLQRTKPAPKPPATAKTAVLAAKQVKKSYFKGKLEVPVLRGVDFAVQPGEFVAIIGQSGSGKSTLLHLLGTLDAPSAGEITFEGNRIDNLPTASRDVLRNKYFGMIFQFYHLLPELSMLENVLAPLMISDGIWKYLCNRGKYSARAKELLDMVGLSHRLTHKPKELSGGEMQRTAIARALMSQPKVLLADEPTGNLDQQTGEEILSLLKKLNEEQGLSIIMVTHDQAIARQAHRIVRLVEGRVQE
ncbi:P-loop containing nucleoside triphosphate hydrolase [Anatilimnocola aggregata]|uniref:P-loop containing nucleoside triphosphate hydrolase n=1 Tax=Anatilimnocola aggregata TaxID=2528021 RepID=A0A517Y9E9_9BACT|nr:ABC transporter ATP-binding protein [Anatilimnocola aggregata]QDU26859.1 P-loop containing nucleoside triphosphate hydrolase [Anatilimnocola aggregata]